MIQCTCPSFFFNISNILFHDILSLSLSLSPFQTQLAGHPNIIHFITAASSKDPGGGSAEFLIVTELVTGKEIIDKILDFMVCAYVIFNIQI